MKKHLAFGIGVISAFAALVFFMRTIQVNATNVYIHSNLTVSPSIISFETVFPGEVLFEPLNISLSGSFMRSGVYDDIEYRILQKIKPRRDDPYKRAYCQDHPTDYKHCYPSLCPYLSKEPDNNPANDEGVPAFHDPNATSSIAFGRLAKSDDDLSDSWVIDLHTPCFTGRCDQSNDTPSGFTIDPRLNGQKFGCDLIVEVVKKSYFVTRTIGFWQTHTDFTSKILEEKLGGNMNVGTTTHVRIVTNDPGNRQSKLFGAYYSSIPKKTNGSNRRAVDKARIALLQHLVAAKLNCAAFSCGASIKILIANADSAYAAGNISLMGTFASQLNAYNNMGDSFPIPSELGSPGSATPGASSSRANKIFWDSP